jgi:hypothetical protein
MGILDGLISGAGQAMADIATQNMQQQNQLNLMQAQAEAEQNRQQALISFQNLANDQQREDAASDIQDSQKQLVDAAMTQKFGTQYDADADDTSLPAEQQALKTQLQADPMIMSKAAMLAGRPDEAVQYAQIGAAQQQAANSGLHALPIGTKLVGPDGAVIADNHSDIMRRLYRPTIGAVGTAGPQSTQQSDSEGQIAPPGASGQADEAPALIDQSSDKAPGTTATIPVLPLPASKGALIPNKVYSTKKGTAIWNGNAFVSIG